MLNLAGAGANPDVTARKPQSAGRVTGAFLDFPDVIAKPTRVAAGDVWMPSPHPPELGQRGAEPARQGGKAVREIRQGAEDLGGVSDQPRPRTG
jgi:hypothetical protein